MAEVTRSCRPLLAVIIRPVATTEAMHRIGSRPTERNTQRQKSPTFRTAPRGAYPPVHSEQRGKRRPAKNIIWDGSLSCDVRLHLSWFLFDERVSCSHASSMTRWFSAIEPANSLRVKPKGKMDNPPVRRIQRDAQPILVQPPRPSFGGYVESMLPTAMAMN